MYVHKCIPPAQDCTLQGAMHLVIISFTHASTFFSLLLILLDIDECAIGTDMCDMNANCTNTDGGYNCTCQSGYSGNGVDCEGMYICTYMQYVLKVYIAMYVRNCHSTIHVHVCTVCIM